MDAKTRRLMKSKQGITKEGITENIKNGDIRIESTKEGPMLFARFKGEWLKTPLVPLDRVIPKIWTVTVHTTAGSTGNYDLAKIPDFINLDNILGLTLSLKKVLSSIPMYFWSPSSSSLADMNNLFGVRSDRRTIFAVAAAGLGGYFQDADLTLSILYK
tara:strand:- start:265 stop:741 length:477 start_codon:yes stop_codon:yes gene_type:complete